MGFINSPNLRLLVHRSFVLRQFCIGLDGPCRPVRGHPFQNQVSSLDLRISSVSLTEDGTQTAGAGSTSCRLVPFLPCPTLGHAL